MLRLIGYFFSFFIMIGLLGAGVFTLFVMHITKGLPNYEVLSKYEPPVTTRFHAAEGSLIGEYAHENRLYLPIEAIPRRVKEAFLSAEDKNFYIHSGIDLSGLLRAVVINLRNIGLNRRPVGASTITQQVAKNFLLTSDQTLERKIKELILSLRIERAYSKDRILELYMNEIFFGLGAYGVASAALAYFGKAADRLTIAEAAYLAALPKGPANYHPFKNPNRALARRNWIIELMIENGYISRKEGEKEKKSPLGVKMNNNAVRFFPGEYFTEEVRREIIARYGEKTLYEGGLSVRTTLDPTLQNIARKVMKDSMIRYDTLQGYRGSQEHVTLSDDWGHSFSKNVAPIPDWSVAVVLSVSSSRLSIGLQPNRSPSGALSSDRKTGVVELADTKWVLNSFIDKKRVRHKSLDSVFKKGDIVYVEKKTSQDNRYLIRQFPLISGGMVVMDPHTGRVFAMVGGFSYAESQFNRATQAMRQPGSAFKPIVYAAALDNGYTPASVIMDAPITIHIGSQVWTPKNYDNSFSGPSTLRSGIERSRNLMTVRLAHDMGMKTVSEYAERFGLYQKLAPHIAMSLGAGETTVMRMVSAYAVMANGGLSVTPSLIDRIQDRYGKTIFRNEDVTCKDCSIMRWEKQDEPLLVDTAEQVLDPMTCYQITSMMRGVVERGTAQSLHDLGYPIAGKTGTTSHEKDAWFIGYTPNLVVGLYLGFDKPSSLGRKVTGNSLAVPVFKQFMKEALKNFKPVDFTVPDGMQLLPINRKTGMHSLPEDPETIVEAFKPGTGPADSYSVIGMEDGIESSDILSPQIIQSIHDGAGGLY